MFLNFFPRVVTKSLKHRNTKVVISRIFDFRSDKFTDISYTRSDIWLVLWYSAEYSIRYLALTGKLVPGLVPRQHIQPMPSLKTKFCDVVEARENLAFNLELSYKSCRFQYSQPLLGKQKGLLLSRGITAVVRSQILRVCGITQRQ